MEEKIIAVPPGPNCKNCGHPPCEFCGNWCDRITDDGLCCDGSCEYDHDNIRRIWVDRVRDMIKGKGYVITQQYGPFYPSVIHHSIFKASFTGVKID